VSEASVLVVEDEPEIATLYEQFLDDRYDVTVVSTVEAAVETVSSSFDAVLLDRRLPDGEGSEVLTHMRSAGDDCRVAMVTAVKPDYDIIEMGFDLYVMKPVDRERLQTALETLLAREQYDDLLREAAALASKRAVLEAQHAPEQLEAKAAYTPLVNRLEAIDTDIDNVAASLSPADYRMMFRDLGRH
jgi:DNA-binding response OmpR family regulator